MTTETTTTITEYKPNPSSISVRSNDAKTILTVKTHADKHPSIGLSVEVELLPDQALELASSVLESILNTSGVDFRIIEANLLAIVTKGELG